MDPMTHAQWYRAAGLAVLLAGTAAPAVAQGADGSRTTAQAGGSGARPTAKKAAAPADTQWVSYDAAKNLVSFKLVAGPFVFNGYGSGEASLIVPPKSTVVINFVQDDGTPHSAEIDSGEGPLPNGGGTPAIPRAYTNKVIEGLPQGATDVIRFTAPESGTYRIICGVPGHALSGMWIWFKVDPSAKTARFRANPKG